MLVEGMGVGKLTAGVAATGGGIPGAWVATGGALLAKNGRLQASAVIAIVEIARTVILFRFIMVSFGC